jgi:hypothetical protein
LSQQINLFNPIFLKQEQVFSSAAMARALLLLVAGTLALAAHGNRSTKALELEMESGKAQLAQRQARLVSATEQFVPRQMDADLAAQLAAAEVQLKGMQEVGNILQRGEFGNTRGYAEYFKAFARQGVSGLWLTGVAISGAGADIGIHGRALQPALVPGYIGRLAQEPVLRGKTFASLNITRPGQEAAPLKEGAAAPELAPYVDFSLQSKAEGAR